MCQKPAWKPRFALTLWRTGYPGFPGFEAELLWSCSGDQNRTVLGAGSSMVSSRLVLGDWDTHRLHGLWKDFRAARIHQFSWKFCLPAPMFLSGTPFSGLADLLVHLQCSRLPWEPEDCCCFHIVFLVFPHRMVLALIFPSLQSTAVALQLLSDFFCSPYESHRNT